jgi:hypothetical protein
MMANTDGNQVVHPQKTKMEKLCHSIGTYNRHSSKKKNFVDELGTAVEQPTQTPITKQKKFKRGEERLPFNGRRSSLRHLVHIHADGIVEN